MTNSDALELELMLIRELNPKWNIDGHGPNLNSRKSQKSTSIYLGVSRIRGKDRWRAWFKDGVKKVHIGNYASEEMAAIARDKYMVSKGMACHLNSEISEI